MEIECHYKGVLYIKHQYRVLSYSYNSFLVWQQAQLNIEASCTFLSEKTQAAKISKGCVYRKHLEALIDLYTFFVDRIEKNCKWIVFSSECTANIGLKFDRNKLWQIMMSTKMNLQTNFKVTRILHQGILLRMKLTHQHFYVKKCFNLLYDHGEKHTMHIRQTSSLLVNKQQQINPPFE